MSSIDPVSSISSAYQTSSTQENRQAKTDFKALAEALKSGDISAAQTALATLQKDAPNLAQYTTGKNLGGTQSSPLGDLAAALGKGDLSAAQTAMAALQKGRHGHHHHRASSVAATGSAPTATNTPDASDTAGVNLNVKG
jgi:soluble cytochrome b562